MFDKIKPLFSSQSLSSGIYKNAKIFLVCIVLLVSSGIGLVLLSEWKKNQEKKVSDSLYTLRKSLEKAGNAVNGKDYRKNTKRFANFLKPEKKEVIYSEEMKTLATSYEEALKSHKKTYAAASFAIDLADFYFLHGEKEKARNLLSLFTFPKKPSTIYHLISFQLATYYMDEKNCKKALPLWESLTQNKKASPFYKESYLQMAFCYERENQISQAKKFYEKIIKEFPEDFTSSKAKDYIRLLKLRSQLK